MIFISKMIPNEQGGFYAFGRVFSGTAITGEQVRIMGPNFKKGGKRDLSITKIKDIYLSNAG